jgi:hypothetical protein
MAAFHRVQSVDFLFVLIGTPPKRTPPSNALSAAASVCRKWHGDCRSTPATAQDSPDHMDPARHGKHLGGKRSGVGTRSWLFAAFRDLKSTPVAVEIHSTVIWV